MPWREWIESQMKAFPKARAVTRGFITEWRAIAILVFILVNAGNMFFEIVEDFAIEDPFSAIDRGIFDYLQAVRTPSLDALMVGITQLGDTLPVLLVSLSVAAWLVHKRAWHPLLFFSLAVGGGALLNSAMKLILQRSRPLDLYPTGVDAFSFPSGHTTSNALLYGFLVVMVCKETSVRFRLWTAATALGLVGLIAFSRVYLGAHWASDIAGGLTFAAAWIALLATYYYWRSPGRVSGRSLMIVAAIALAAAGGAHILANHAARLAHYQAVAS